MCYASDVSAPVSHGLAAPPECFRQEFLRLLLARAPGSVLDVGCGSGELIEALAQRDVRASGVDIDARAIESAAQRGVDVRLTAAEQLPFADGSFEWVVTQYAVHHFAKVRPALLEMWRVAHRGLLVLEPWYDSSLVSQRVAHALDRWSKRIDRRRGMVHNDCLLARDILGPFTGDATLRIDRLHPPPTASATRRALAERMVCVRWVLP